MRTLTWLALVLSLVLLGAGTRLQGATTVTMPTGDYLVVDPDYDAGSVLNVGRVQAYSVSGTLLTTLTGSQANDRVGSGGVVSIGPNSYVICSPEWDNGALADAGAITVGNVASVFTGPVGTDNSRTGSKANDQVGGGGITLVGTYCCVVCSPLWDNGTVVNAGAVSSFYATTTYAAAPISSANSMVGGSAEDRVGSGGVAALSANYFVFSSPLWDRGTIVNAGAVTTSGVASNTRLGTVSTSNSLAGTTAGDQVGSGGVGMVESNYLFVSSPLWDNGTVADVGAVTVRPLVGFLTPGAISAANSMVGTVAGDQVGSGGVREVNGDVLISSPLWDHGAAVDAGAVTLGLMTLPDTGVNSIVGTLSESNSIVGTSAGDQIGSGGVTEVAGSVLIHSPLWDNGAVADVGAVTLSPLWWPNTGVNNLVGTLSASNSMVGVSAGDQIGSGGITEVDADHVIIHSPLYDNGAATNAGAVTLGPLGYAQSGINLIKGEISSANSLVGSSAGDSIGSGGIIEVGTHHVIIHSPLWDNGAATNAGAVTLGPLGYAQSGINLIKGEVSAANSLVGSTAGDQIGSGGITEMGTDHVVIYSPLWNNGTAADAGAVTLGPLGYAQSGINLIKGVVSAANSLVGSSAGDQIGSGGVTEVIPGHLLIRSPLWDNGAEVNAGAVTVAVLNWAYTGINSVVGVISASNSMVGATTADQFGSGGVTVVGSDHLLIHSPLWDNGAVTNVGAVTVGPISYASTGIPFFVGQISPANSIVGSSAEDQIGSGGVTEVTAGYLLIRSPLWDNGAAANAGAVTVGAISYAHTGIPFFRGQISAANSVVGSSANDQAGSGGVTYNSSTYIMTVRSPNWDNGAVANAGAVTFLNRMYFSGGTVTAANSLVGSSTNDQVGSGGITTVTSSYFLVRSPNWDSAGVSNVGAVTPVNLQFFSGATVSATNSLVGSSASDQVGSGGVTLLGTTAYLIRSPLWNHKNVADAGAVTFATPNVPIFGAITRFNSLVGSHGNDQIGSGGITTAGGGASFTITSPNWCYGAGASTAGTRNNGISGVVSAGNSTVGAESAVPEIALLQPFPTEVPHNGSFSFPSTPLYGTQRLDVVIQNTGTDDLWLTDHTPVAFTSTGVGQFSVVTQPEPFVPAGGTVTFTLQFAPRTGYTPPGETVTGQIHISNNDSDESPYLVNLTGNAFSHLPVWRQTHFGSSANTGNAADGADFDNDGIPNLVEYAMGLNPVQSASSQLPLPATSGGNFNLSFTDPPGAYGIAYGAEWSTSLVGGSWQYVPDTGTYPQHVFSVPTAGKQQIFMRLTILAVP